MTLKEQHDFENTLAEVEKTLPMITQALALYYKSLVNQGFTDEQALYLVGVHGTSFGHKEVR
jgi:hypothetical protein